MKRYFNVLMAAVFALSATTQVVHAQSPTPSLFILFGHTELLYELPDRYVFKMEVSTPTSTPTSASIAYYYTMDDKARSLIEIDPGNHDTLLFTLDTDEYFIYPFTPIHV